MAVGDPPVRPFAFRPPLPLPPGPPEGRRHRPFDFYLPADRRRGRRRHRRLAARMAGTDRTRARAALMQTLRPASPAFLVTLAVLAALAHAVWAVTASVDKSMTADEIAHLTAGHVYNTLGDYRFQPENGNLPQRWAALPLLLASAPLPPTT